MSRADVLREAMVQVHALVALARGLDAEVLADGVRQLEIGDALAPVLYPSEWLERHQQEGRLRDLVAATLEYRKALDGILGVGEQIQWVVPPIGGSRP
jgi:hypothetical protein